MDNIEHIQSKTNQNKKDNSNYKINVNIYGNSIINPYFINSFFNPNHLNLLNNTNPFLNPINFPASINSSLFTNLNSNIIKKEIWKI